MVESDPAWKIVCEKKLPLVLELLYPRLYQLLDRTRDDESLDQELKRFAPGSESGGRIADRLIKTYFKDVDDARFLHMEVQGKKERGFARRIHICNYRAEERFNAHVISLVILTDENPNWRPDRYVAGQIPVEVLQAAATPQPEIPAEVLQAAATPQPEIPATVLQAAATPQPQGKKNRQRYYDERTLRFLMVKLIDFRGRETELEAMVNPMGLFVVAHLEAIRTRDNLEAREVAKLRLLKNLRQRNMDQEDTRLWTTCLDYLLQLEPERELALYQDLERLDSEEHMEFAGYLERRGIEKGKVQTLRDNVIRLGRRFYGATSESNLEAIRRIEDIARLERMFDATATAQSWEQLLATP